jgi:hypothetical protein
MKAIEKQERFNHKRNSDSDSFKSSTDNVSSNENVKNSISDKNFMKNIIDIYSMKNSSEQNQKDSEYNHGKNKRNPSVNIMNVLQAQHPFLGKYQ